MIDHPVISCCTKVVRWGYRGKIPVGILFNIPDTQRNPAIGELRFQLAHAVGRSTPDNHESYMLRTNGTNVCLFFSDLQMYVCSDLEDGDTKQEPTGDIEILK